MRKSIITLGIVALFILISPFVKAMEEKTKVREFCMAYGWQVGEKNCDSEDVLIPKPLDNVYTKYNALQKEMGFNLNKHCGKKARRYTYEVLNHKFGKGVYVNVLVCGGAIIAADVMTNALDGFMHGVNRREYINET